MHPIAVGTAVVAGAAISLPVVIPLAVGAAGFGAGGIVAGSWAASFMATYGGAVGVGSACATLQSVGVVGLGVGGNIIAAAVGGATAGVAVVKANAVNADQPADSTSAKAC